MGKQSASSMKFIGEYILTNTDRESPLPSADWERRQKHAAFFQTMLGSVQQSALSMNTTAVILITVGSVVAKFSGVLESHDWIIFAIAIVAWALLSGILVSGFGRSAMRIEATYLKEHAELFPSAGPYRLESYLLDFAERNPWLVGKRARS